MAYNQKTDDPQYMMNRAKSVFMSLFFSPVLLLCFL
jgi:hypothetical protein